MWVEWAFTLLFSLLPFLCLCVFCVVCVCVLVWCVCVLCVCLCGVCVHLCVYVCICVLCVCARLCGVVCCVCACMCVCVCVWWGGWRVLFYWYHYRIISDGCCIKKGGRWILPDRPDSFFSLFLTVYILCAIICPEFLAQWFVRTVNCKWFAL